jgi:hypothetical protein
MELSLQGTLIAGANILYTCPVGMTAKVSFTFNNPAAYNITLSRYDASLMITTNVYTFALAAGDVVVDNKFYYMKEGDSLSLNSSIAGTNYIAYIVEYPA